MADRSRARRVSVAPPSVAETVQAKGGRAGLADAVRKVTNIGASIEAMKARRTERRRRPRCGRAPSRRAI